MPKLATFIRDNIEPILSEWESFARSLPQGDTMDITALRDHAREMLTVIAEDLDEPQTRREQSDKSKGRSDADAGESPTAAQEHGAGRAESGFTVEQMVAEFRALRSSVIHLWTKTQGEASRADIEDMTRFNEAIDQAIAESITRYTRDIDQSKERFLAILGHDLRTPLNAIITSSAFMLDTGDLKEPFLALVAGMGSSARRMSQMVADLLDFTLTRFGDTIPIQRSAMDIRRLVHDVVTEVGASYPDSNMQIDTSGDLRGEWDSQRLTQAVTNLVANAVQHGDEQAPIKVVARGNAKEVVIEVHSRGQVIAASQRAHIFESMKQGRPDGRGDRRHLGLGLYIVDKIVVAHGGTISVESSAEKGTVFTVNLPRVA